MSDHSFTVRLDMGYEDEKQAWAKLKRLQRKTHLSYNRIVTDAANVYETDFVHLAPEDEAQLIQRMTDAVAERLQQILPAYLAGYSAGAASTVAVPPVPQVETEDKAIHPKPTEADEADHDFSGSVMDFNFMGM
mgnify:FL=1